MQSTPVTSESPERPRAVIVTTTFPARSGDGTPEFVLTLARSIRSFDVTVVAPRMAGAPRYERIDSVDVVRVPYFPRRWERLASDAILPTIRAQPWTLLQVPSLLVALLWGTWRTVRRTKATVVNAHWIAPAGVIAAVLRVLGGPPFVLTVHGADAYALRGAGLRHLKRWVLGRAAAVAPVSSDIAATLGLSAASPVLRMGVDTVALRAEMGPREPRTGHAVYIGRLAEKKGVDVLLEAMARVPDATLMVVGDGPDRAGLDALSARLGLEARVRFAGRQPRDGVLAALREASVVVIPSRVGSDGDQEGTPVVLAEAMGAGVPVIASRLGGLEECIEDRHNGVLVPPNDIEALADALREVLGGGLDLRQMSDAALATAAVTLDIGSVGAAYDQLLADAS